jgi:hypothetical protein
MISSFGSWSVLTVSFLFVLYISLAGVVLSAVLHLVNGQWRFQIRKLACAFAALFPVAGVMLLILLFNADTTFQWLQKDYPEGYLPGWHDKGFLIGRQIGGFLFVAALAGLFIKYQHLSEIDSSYQVQRRFRNIALFIPFVYFGYGTMMGWDYEMTMVPNWHSSSYGAYHFQSMFHMFLAFFTIFLFFIYRSGRLVQPFQPYIFNYFAQFLLAMTILWTYLFFTQYLIMWYGRLPWETDRYDAMMFEGLGPLWWTFVLCKFAIPFSLLVLTPTRVNPPLITALAGLIVFGTFLERYTWISGSVDSQFYRMPMTSMFDIIVVLATIGVCWFVMSRTLVKYGLIHPPSKQAAAPDRTG